MRKCTLGFLVLLSAVAVGCGEVATSPSRLPSPGATANTVNTVSPQPNLIGEQDD